jgi:predicted ATPase/class 3 adenylate cyclase/Tfp pilus assembly protein PilF
MERALLLTDVVDSTPITEAIGEEAAAALWQAHDRVARDLLRTWRGREIDKTDGVLAMFERVADAVGCALAWQGALAALQPPLTGRAGIAFGGVSLRENSAADVAQGAKPVEIDGMVKIMAARVMPIARAGQTLLSGAARAALGPGAWRVESHGHWRLKGLSEPVELFEVGAEGAAFVPPPAIAAKAYRVVRDGNGWLPVERIAYALPAERDAFVGREGSLGELSQALDGDARLVTLVGIGGCGKTRLATHFAWRWLGDYPGGTWFCDLSAARSVDGIAQAVADALDVPLGKDDPVEQLGHAIAGRGPCLLILDNFEQVARHADETLGRWLDRAAGARFVVTSREVLGLTGEKVLSLAPLPAAEAAALFLRRAQAARHDFVPGADDAAAIDPLVRLLDGLPLAIELAAARVRVLSPRTLLARMSERFKLLASSGGRHGRQSTLRATFDWSWDQLADADKAALAQLSVFEGGFTLESAEAVVDLSSLPGAWLVDVMQSLVEKSLVRRVGERRFDLLSSVQDYAAEHLRTAGRFADSGPAAHLAAQQRHGQHFAALDERAAIRERGIELDNLIAACRRGALRGDGAAAAGALEGAWAALRLRGPFRAGVDLAEAVCAMGSLEAAQRAAAELVAGTALDACGCAGEAIPRLDHALALARQARDAHREAQILGRLAGLHGNEGRTQEADAELAAALALASGDAPIECELRNARGSLCIETGRLDEARAEYEAALGLANRLDDRRWQCGTLGNLGNLHFGQGRLDDAQRCYEAGLRFAREIGHRQWEGNMTCNLGFMHFTRGQMAEASKHLEAALQVAREIGHARLECIVLGNLAIASEALADAARAEEQFDGAVQLARRIGEPRFEGEFLGYLGALHARAGRAAAARRCLDDGEALLRRVRDRLGLGVLLCCRAEAEQRVGAVDAARAALAEASGLAEEAGAGAESELGKAIARVAGLVDAG